MSAFVLMHICIDYSCEMKRERNLLNFEKKSGVKNAKCAKIIRSCHKEEYRA